MADSLDAAIVGGVVLLWGGIIYVKRARERRAGLRWFTCEAPLGGRTLQWRADLETLALTLANTDAGNIHDLAVESLELRRAEGGWRMRPTGEPSVELTQVLESALVANPDAPASRGCWYDVPSSVAIALEVQHQRFAPRTRRS